MTKPQCGNCRFWKHEETYEKVREGVCRRHPPVVRALLRNQPYIGTEYMETLRDHTHWPFVKDDDWCGEYKSANV